MSWIALLLVGVCMAAGWAASVVGIPHGTGPGFPSERSDSPPVVWQVWLPWDLAGVGFVISLGG